MLTVEDLENLIDQMSDRQADRLTKSGLGMEAFLAQRVERDVTAEIVELNKVIVSMRTIATHK